MLPRGLLHGESQFCMWMAYFLLTVGRENYKSKSLPLFNSAHAYVNWLMPHTYLGWFLKSDK